MNADSHLLTKHLEALNPPPPELQSGRIAVFWLRLAMLAIACFLVTSLHIQTRRPDTPIVEIINVQTDNIGDAALSRRLLHPPEMIFAPIELPEKLLFIPSRAPQDLCSVLEEVGYRVVSWDTVRSVRADWSCFTEILEIVDQPLPPPAPSEGEQRTNLFVALRGDNAERLGHILLKLNLYDVATSQEARNVLKSTVERLAQALLWNPPQDLFNAIDSFTPYEENIAGISIALKAENDDVARYALTIQFPRTPAYVDTNALVKRPPFGQARRR